MKKLNKVPFQLAVLLLLVLMLPKMIGHFFVSCLHKTSTLSARMCLLYLLNFFLTQTLTIGRKISSRTLNRLLRIVGSFIWETLLDNVPIVSPFVDDVKRIALRMGFFDVISDLMRIVIPERTMGTLQRSSRCVEW